MAITRTLFAVVAAAAPFAPLAALAQPPPAPAPPVECSSARGAEGYTGGYQDERDLLEGIWYSGFDCSTLDDYIAAIDVSFTPSAASPYLRCRGLGVLDAIEAAIADKVEQCGPPVECSQIGEVIGWLSGEIYCGSEYPQCVAPHDVCGPEFAFACKATMQAHVHANCAAKADADPWFDETVESFCAY